MEKEAVPQDYAPTREGVRKLLYAVDDHGNYVGVPSSGWDVETFATQTAVFELDRLRRDAWQRAKDGLTSALEFHMYRARMDVDTLAATSGIWRWRVKRHLHPQRFAKLSKQVLERYATALGVQIKELKALPTNPD